MDQSNNTTVSSETHSMRTSNFLQYIMSGEYVSDGQFQNNISSLNMVDAFLNDYDNSTDIENVTHADYNEQSNDTLPPTTLTNDIHYTNIYMRFLEDILQLPPLTVANNDVTRLLYQTLEEDKNPIKYVLSEDGAKTIMSVKYNSETYPDIDCCPITMKDFIIGETISKLPCNHLFNSEAISKWLKEEKAECPICRCKLPSAEKKTEKNVVDVSNNIVHRMSIPQNNVELNGFGPPRMLRQRHNNHLLRLMASRQARQEEEELQTVLLASLGEQ